MRGIRFESPLTGDCTNALLKPISLGDDEIEQTVNLARGISRGLDAADKDFDKRKAIIEILDVRGVLAVENGEKVVYVTMRLTGDEPIRLSVTNWPKLEQSSIVTLDFSAKVG